MTPSIRRISGSRKGFSSANNSHWPNVVRGNSSQGKSSTINSLLQLWNSKYQRLVDLNPTDKVITLITHEQNANSLHGVLGQGSVPTRVQTVDSELLDQIVLVDTPGTGDPHLLEEMARDFLPVCDLVLFFLSAANPLDATDIPLLSELHRRLPFIPLLFVITRADELRKNSDIPLSRDNYDLARAAVFIGDLKSRISLLLKPNIGETEFILIDNKSRFQIEELRGILLSRVDPNNISVRLNLHSHKIRFFQTTAERLRDYFLSFLDGKLSELNSIVAGAETNIHRYQQAVTISNNNLTKSWFDNHASILETLDKANKRLRSLSDLPHSYLASSVVSEALVKMRADNKLTAGSTLDQIRRHAMQTGFNQLQREFGRAIKDLSSADLDNCFPQDHGILPASVQWGFGEIAMIPSAYLTARADVFRKGVRDFVLNSATEIRLALEEILRLIQTGYLVDKCVDIINNAQESLDRDVELYFQNVRVYRSGVFSMSTKDSIAKLGIGGELDQIESEFTEEDKEAIQIAARGNLFPESAEKVATLTKQLSAISDQIRQLLQEVNQFVLDSPNSLSSRIEFARDERMPILLKEIKDGLERDADDLVTEAQSRASAIIGEVLKEYSDEISEARAERRRNYVIALILASFVSIVIFLGYRWLRQPVGQSKLEVVLWGLAVNLLGDGIGLGIARLRDHYPKTKPQIKARHVAILAERVRASIEEATRNAKLTTLEASRLGTQLERVYAEITEGTTDPWREQLEDRYNMLKVWTNKTLGIRSSYISALGGFAKDCAKYFEDAESNLESLKMASHSFKERAIEPSFDLLEKTSTELRTLKEEITGIRFS